MIEILIASRGSRLALWQSEHVRDLLSARFPEHTFRIEIIHTKGDKILDVALSKIGDKGLFTKEIEAALLDGRCRFAVHSLKDMPTKVPDGLTLGAITKRHDMRDAWVSKDGTAFRDLPQGAAIATGSLRRRCQLWAHRPDLDIREIRGNLDTRLRKLDDTDDLRGIVLAAAGLERLGLDARITHKFEPEDMLPAVGQGALAIECRADDAEILEILAALDDPEMRASATAERALLAKLEGGCQIPIGAYGRLEGGRLFLDALVGSLDGRRVIRNKVDGAPEDAHALGVELAELLLAAGAGPILAEILKDAPR